MCHHRRFRWPLLSVALDGPDVSAMGAAEDDFVGSLLHLHDRFPAALLAEDESLTLTGWKWWEWRHSVRSIETHELPASIKNGPSLM